MAETLARDLSTNGLYGVVSRGAPVDTFLRLEAVKQATGLGRSTMSYRQILVTAGPVRRRRLWADGRSGWR